MSDHDVTQWLGRLGDGDPRAASAIWARYFGRLAAFARRRLEGLPCREADEEDVALSAMHSFCRGMAAGRFPALDDREDLWKLLVTITARKACAQRRRHYAGKRGGGLVRGESIFARPSADDDAPGIAEVLGSEPTPELANMVADECRQMLDCLGDETLRQIAVYALEGYGAAEIAEKVGCVPRTVERKLERIRQKWSREELV